MFVKICGITNESDALMAVAMGADAVGFIFAPSSRQVAPPMARDIVRRLPPEILTVGVFRDEAPQRVVELVNQVGLRAAQLHGHESPGEVKWVRQRVPYVIKALAADDRMVDRADEYVADALLLDSSSPGSGEVFDWSLADRVPRDATVILAGGLDPTNVAAAIERVAPWGVDVASGVESSPGRKDVLLTRRFCNAAKAFEEDNDVPLEELPVAELRSLDPGDYPDAPGLYDWDLDPEATQLPLDVDLVDD